MIFSNSRIGAFVVLSGVAIAIVFSQMEIHHATVNFIDKEQHGTSLLRTRSSELAIDAKLKGLAMEVYRRYLYKASKAHGKFNSDEVVFRFSAELKRYRRSECDFQEFSIKSVKIADDRTSSEPLAVGGYYLFVEFSFQNRLYIMISVLRNKVGAVINDSLEIENSAHLNVEDLSLVALINLTTWENSLEDRYISFIRDRGASVLPNYFLKFIGAEEVIDTKKESEALCIQINNYLDSSGLDETRQNDIKSEVADYVVRRNRDKEPVVLEEVARIVDSAKPENFIKTASESETPISSFLEPYMREFKILKQISLNSGGITITFDRNLLYRNVEVDREARVIIFRNVPEEMIRQFNEER